MWKLFVCQSNYDFFFCLVLFCIFVSLTCRWTCSALLFIRWLSTPWPRVGEMWSAIAIGQYFVIGILRDFAVVWWRRLFRHNKGTVPLICTREKEWHETKGQWWKAFWIMYSLHSLMRLRLVVWIGKQNTWGASCQNVFN